MTVWKFLKWLVTLLMVLSMKLNVLLGLLAVGVLVVGGILLHRRHDAGNSVLVPSICMSAAAVICVGLAFCLPGVRLGSLLFF